MTRQVQVTFGIIVLNGEPFTRYNLRALYPFAHQIIVVEGGSTHSASAARHDGHSSDGTLELLYQFKVEEDPDNKIIIVTAEDEGHPDGFWPGEKNEQSQAYAKRATGEWLWQVDVDEFYHQEDILKVYNYLDSHPNTTCISFNAYHFWGGFTYIVNGGIYQSIRFAGEPKGACRRIFKWGQFYTYATHRPPTVLDANKTDMSKIKLINATDELAIRMHHYFMVFPFQMRFKSAYYEGKGWSFARGMVAQYKNHLNKIDIKNGIKISNQFGTYNWLERFTGTHPTQLQQLYNNIKSGQYQIEMRHTNDIEQMLNNQTYQKLVGALQITESIRSYWHLIHYKNWLPIRRQLVKFFRNLVQVMKQFS